MSVGESCISKAHEKCLQTLAKNCHLVFVVKQEKINTSFPAVPQFPEADCDPDREDQKPCSGRTRFALCRDITCSDEWFHNICCVEIWTDKTRCL